MKTIKIRLKIYYKNKLIKTVDDELNETWWLDNCNWLNSRLLKISKEKNIDFTKLKYDMELSNKQREGWEMEVKMLTKEQEQKRIDRYTKFLNTHKNQNYENEIALRIKWYTTPIKIKK